MAIYNLIKTDWSSLFPRAKQYTIEHAPQILTGIGVSALIGAGIVAVKNTPEAYEKIQEKKRDEGVDKLPLWDIIKLGAKYYVVPAGMAIAGATCVFSGLKVSTDRADAFAALAASQAVRLKDMKDAVRDKFGDKKADEVEEEVARKEIERDGIPDIKWIEETGHGDQIVWWPNFGRWFKCDIGWIRRVVNEINKEIEEGDVNENDPFDTRTLNGVCVNRFMAGIGIAKCDIGMLLGWNGKNKLHPKFYDITNDRESEKAVVLVMKMDDCMPREKWDTVRQNKQQYLAPF